MALSGTFYQQPNNEFGLKCVWSAVQDNYANQSTITLNVYLRYWSISIGARNGQDCWIDNSMTDCDVAAWSSYPNTWTDKFLYSKTYTVTHNPDGNRDVWMSASYYIGGTIGGYSYSTLTASTTVSLDWLNMYPPTITLSLSEITATSVRVTATSNVPCGTWNYAYDSSGWIWFENRTTTSVTYVVTGLSAGASHDIGIRGYRSSNGITGDAWVAMTTLGASYPVATADNKLESFAIDAPTATLKLKWNCFVTGYYHWIEFLTGADTLLAEWTNIHPSATGVTTKSLNFTSTHRNQVAANMSTVKEKLYWVRITTYSGINKSGQISTPTSMEVFATTSSANSAPTLTSIAYYDSNTACTALTGNNQYIVQLISNLKMTASGVSAKFGASITGYSATINGVTKTSASSPIDVGPVDIGSDSTASVTVHDSRGYSKTLTLTVDMISYSYPNSSITVRRQNGVDNIIQLEISGSISGVIIDGVQKNSVLAVKWKYMSTSDTTFGSDTIVSHTATGTNYSFEDMDLTNSADVFDVNHSYYIRITVTDKFGAEVKDFLIPQSTPLVSLRPGRVGINKSNPTVALDVIGGFMVDGYSPMIFISGIEENEDLNDYKDSGIYVVSLNATAATVSNIPVADAGTLEVVNTGGVFSLQRYTNHYGSMYFRTYNFDNSTWQSWKTVTST